METLREAQGPDLLADHEIFRIDPERGLPFGDGLVALAGPFEQTPEPQLCLHELGLDRREPVGLLRHGTGAGIATGLEPRHRVAVAGVVHREAAKLRPADHAVFVDQDPVRDDLVTERVGEPGVVVDQDGEGDSGRLYKLASTLRTGVLFRDGDDFETGAAFFIEGLPPGQLLSAASPRRPHEHQQAPTEEVVELSRPPI